MTGTDCVALCNYMRTTCRCGCARASVQAPPPVPLSVQALSQARTRGRPSVQRMHISSARASTCAGYVHASVWLRALRRAGVATAAAVALAVPSARPAAVRAQTTHRPVVAGAILFDRSYTHGAGGLWDAVGVAQPASGSGSGVGVNIDESSEPPPSSQSKKKGKKGMKGVPRRVRVEDELRVLQRLVVATAVGGIIGVERRSAKSFAGVRTFSLVSLGSAIFMSTILLAFPNADPARIAAAVSSSVGFIGGGVMSKPTPSVTSGGPKHSRGLTTATSVWLAAGLGLAAACGLFVMAFTGSFLTVCIARYARFDNDLQWIKSGDPLGDEGLIDIDDEDDDLRATTTSTTTITPASPSSDDLTHNPLDTAYFHGNGSPGRP